MSFLLVLIMIFKSLMNNLSASLLELRSKSHFIRNFHQVLFGVLMLLLIASTVCVHAQESSQYVMYENAFPVFNPGTTGLYNKYAATFITRFPSSEVMYYSNSESLIYEQRVDKLNSGFGANITYANLMYYEYDWKVALNYAYHFDLKKAGRLGAGLSVGNVFRGVDYDYRYDEGDGIDYRYSRLFLNFGLAYQIKNLNLGVSISELYFTNTSKYGYEGVERKSIVLNAFTSYDIKLNPRLTLTPAIYANFYEKRIHEIDYRMTLNIKERLWVGMSVSNYKLDWRLHTSGPISKLYSKRMIGYDLFGRYRIGYAISLDTFLITNWTGFHEIVLAWRVK